MDLLSILPDFPIGPYEYILLLLERNHITTTDLLTLDTIEIAKRTRVPLTDTRQFTEHVIRALHQDVGFEQEQMTRNEGPEEDGRAVVAATPSPKEPSTFGKLDVSEWSSISILNPILDDVLGGGIPTRYVTEITGESATGKSQFLLHLLLSVQLPRPVGLSKRALYISTESPLPTNRLQQLLETHPAFVTIPSDIDPPSLDNVISLNAIDLETQDHVINYQLPVAVSSYDIGLVVIDSVTWNYRGEYSLDSDGMATRAGELVNLGRVLRDLAVKEDLAVVVANQVLDRFDESDDFPVDQYIHLPPNHEKSASDSSNPNNGAETVPPSSSQADRILSQSTTSTPTSHNVPPSSAKSDPFHFTSTRSNLLYLTHQQRFFTGWGDKPPDTPLRIDDIAGGLKTPALGLLWASQIACRIVLKKRSATLPIPPTDPAAHSSVPSSQIAPQPQSQCSSTPRGPSAPEEGAEPDQSARDIPLKNASAHPEARKDPENELSSTQSDCLEYEPSQEPTIRTMKVVFAPWASGRWKKETSSQVDQDPKSGKEVEFEIWKGGIRVYER